MTYVPVYPRKNQNGEWVDIYPCPACKGTGDDCQSCEGMGVYPMTDEEAAEFHQATYGQSTEVK